MWRRWPTFSSPPPSKDNNNHHHHHHHSSKSSSESPPPSPSPSHSLFRCSSFKDIESLCLDSLKSSLPHSSSSPRPSLFHRTRTAKSLLPLSDTPPKSQSEPEPVITIYYTSLRVVRSTFEACRSVLSVLQGFRVAIDQRDVAMDAGFMVELRDRLAHLKPSTHDLRLPRVFIGSRYIGGADEVLHLNEIGELKKMVKGVPVIPPGTCDTCGGYKFVMCGECHGSRKVFSHKTGFRLCTACNENGLIRCPQCSCPSPPSHTNPSSAFFTHSS